MQLSAARARPWLCALLLMSLPRAPAQADAKVGAGTTVFHEPGSNIHMTVLVPQVDADVELTDGFAMQAAWTADVVSGASVAVVDAPAEELDAVTSATVTDMRHVFGGGLRLFGSKSSLSASYSYGFENDYRSHGFDLRARTELFERNTAFELTYARAFDTVCDGPGAPEAVLKPRLDSSDGCFEDAGDEPEPLRNERDLSLQTFQASWSQNWTPILTMQATATAQVLSGFQVNPYRAVRIGRTAAQEHHPEDRARYALGVALNLWIKPLSGALQGRVRGYRDTWNIRSATAELAYEQVLGSGMRMRVRGRYYAQTAAVFYSDDYVLAPRGQYFTGDRELSAMRSALGGVQLGWSIPADDDGDVLGAFDAFEISAKGDLLKHFFDDFHYDQVKVPNDVALIGTFALSAAF